MASTSKKTVSRTSTAPARRARRAPAATAAAPSTEDIARLAYSYFEASGYAHGHDLEHWLRAEGELTPRA